MATASAPAGSAAAWANWVPRTKFLRPVLGPDIVLDPAVVARVRGALDHARLVLVSGQAGAGKTTLAAAALDAAPELPAAWISLDRSDDGLDNLLHLLAGTLAPVVPGGCPAFADLLRLRLPAAADPRRAIGVLVNDLLAAGSPPLVLALDELDALRAPAVVSALDYLVTYAPPGLRLLATERGDPPLALARLRAQGLLHEAGGNDLRFSLRQTETLLNARLGLGLTAGQVEGIVANAAGWVTGVRLLAQAHARGATVNTTPMDPDLADSGVYDFLTEEILRQETEDVRQFLQDTAVLDEIRPAVAAAVAGRADAAALLEALCRRHHFLVTRGGGTTYRYHPLLRSFLRRQLATREADDVCELHRRAAAIVDRPAARVEHLLAAGETLDAAALLEGLGRELFAQPAQVAPLSAWVERLPEPVRAGRPWLTVIAGLAASQRGDFAPFVPALEAAVDQLAARDDHLGQWLAARLVALGTRGARGGAALAALEASSGFPSLPTAARVDHHINAAYMAMYGGNWPETARRVEAALELTMATGDAGAVEILAQHLSPLLTVADGALPRVEAYAAWTARRFADGSPVVRIGIEHQSMHVAFLRGRLDDAYAAATEARALHVRLGGLPFVRNTLDWVQATTLFARGELGAARTLLDHRRNDPSAAALDQRLSSPYLALLARILRAEERPGDVAQLAAEVDTRAMASLYANVVVLVRLSIRAQAAWAAGDRAGAAALLREALPLEDRLRLVPFAGSPRLDLAVLLLQMGQPEAALREFRTGMMATAGRGLVGLVVAAGAEIVPLLTLAVGRGVAASAAAAVLVVLRQPPPPIAQPIPGSSEVLSSREVEVLRLLVAGASNREIAATLHVSPNTVKTHVGHVLAKLGAHSRAQAAARARAVHLI